MTEQATTLEPRILRVKQELPLGQLAVSPTEIKSVLADSQPSQSGDLVIDAKGTTKNVNQSPADNPENSPKLARDERLDKIIKEALYTTTFPSTPLPPRIESVQRERHISPSNPVPVDTLTPDAPTSVGATDTVNEAAGTPSTTASSSHETLATSEKETRTEILQRISDSVKFFAGLGKTPMLAGQRPHIDFLDAYFVRRPSQDGKIQAFSRDIYTSPLKNIGNFSSLQVTHQLDTNKWVVAPPGEVTLRYVGIKYEDGSEGMVLIVSMAHAGKGKHPFDSRWDYGTDYFMFDLPTAEAKLFLAESIKDPTFVRDALAKITEQKNILESYYQPTHVICATMPGTQSIKVDTTRVNRNRSIPRNGYKGTFVISDGQTVTRHSATQGELSGSLVPDQVDPLAQLEVRLPQTVEGTLNRQQADQAYNNYHTFSQELKGNFLAAANLQNIIDIAERNAKTSAFSQRLSLQLSNALEQLPSIAESVFSVDKTNHGTNDQLNNLCSQIPEELGIRDKCQRGFKVILESLIILRGKNTTLDEIISSLMRIADVVNYAFLEYNGTDTQQWDKQIKHAQSLMRKPIELITYFIDVKQENRLDSTLTTSRINLDGKIFISAWKQWGPWQRFRARQKLKKGEGNTSFLLKAVRQIDPEFHI